MLSRHALRSRFAAKVEKRSPHLALRALPCVLPQDRLLPYMADERRAPGTLFLVAEEDFRLTEEHAMVTPVKVSQTLAPPSAGAGEEDAEVTMTLGEIFRARTKLAPLRGREAAGAATPQKESERKAAAMLGFFKRRRKPTAQEMQNVSTTLQDLAKICTFARRQEAGGLVWLSWRGASGSGKSRKRVPSHGSTLLAATSWTARCVLQDFQRFEFTHFDVALRNVLQNPPASWAWLRASFVYPSIGHYCERVSGCEASLGWRFGVAAPVVPGGHAARPAGPDEQTPRVAPVLPEGRGAALGPDHRARSARAGPRPAVVYPKAA